MPSSIKPIAPLLFVQQMGPAGVLAKETASHPEASQVTFRKVLEAKIYQQGIQIQQILGLNPLATTINEENKNKEKFKKIFKGRHGRSNFKDIETNEDYEHYEEPYIGNIVNRRI